MSTFSLVQSSNFGPLLRLPDTRYIGYSPHNCYLYSAVKKSTGFEWTNFSNVLDIHSIDEAIIGCTFLICYSPYYKLFLSHATSHEAIRKFFTSCGCIIPKDPINFHPESVESMVDEVPLFQVLAKSGLALLRFYANVDGELFCCYGKQILRSMPRSHDNCMVHCLMFASILGIKFSPAGFIGPAECFALYDPSFPFVEDMVGLFKQFHKYDR